MVTLPAGMASNLINEVINGFRVRASEEERRTSYLGDMKRILSDADAKDSLDQEIALDGRDEEIMRWALRLTLEALGANEFFTRTGYDFDLSKALLEERH